MSGFVLLYLTRHALFAARTGNRDRSPRPRDRSEGLGPALLPEEVALRGAIQEL